MTPQLTILEGCCLDRLKDIEAGTVHCCVTSPPYWGLRDYGVKGQLGSEPTPDAYVQTMVEVFREVRRVLHQSGTVFLNCGDSFFNGQSSATGVCLRKDLTESERQYAANELFKVWKTGIERQGEGYVQTLLSSSLHEAQQAEGARILQELLQEELEAHRASHQQQEEGSSNGNDSAAGREVCLLRGDGTDIPLPRPHQGRRAEGIRKKQRASNRAEGDGGRIAEGQVQDSLLELQFSVGALRLLSSLEFNVAAIPNSLQGYFCGTESLKPKDLCLIPWRLAIALQADGWWVRSVICWAKKSCMPESVTDRPTNSWEPIFLLAKNSSYFYDSEAVKEPCPENKNTHMMSGRTRKADPRDRRDGEGLVGDSAAPPTTRNQRNVWHLGPEPYAEAHFATFPSEIPRRAILAGTSARGCCPKCYAPWLRVVEKEKGEPDSFNGSSFNRGKTSAAQSALAKVGETERTTATRTVGWEPGCECQCGGPPGYDPEIHGEHPANCDCNGTGQMAPIPCTVLDPFGGSGTTGAVALELARNATLIELNPDYLALLRNRTNITPGLQLA